MVSVNNSELSLISFPSKSMTMTFAYLQVLWLVQSCILGFDFSCMNI